jgi:Flp pilus assembly protein CpaB
MRLIILLVALLVVGLLVNRQISNGTQHNVKSPAEKVGSDAPKIPVKPQDVQQFEEDMNKFIKDEASEQAEKIDQATQ